MPLGLLLQAPIVIRNKYATILSNNNQNINKNFWKNLNKTF